MTGSLRIIDGKYVASINLHDESGKRHQKKIPLNIDAALGNKRKAEKARQEAEKAKDQVLDEYEEKYKGGYRKDVLFCDYVQAWLAGATPWLELDTAESYASMIKPHIYPYFQALKLNLQDVEYSHIEAYYAEKAKTLSVVTLKKHHAIIVQTLRKAVQNKLIASNPATEYRFPKQKERFKGSFLTVKQGNVLLAAAKGKPIESAIILGMKLGLRRSEIAGLKWGAINFAEDKLSIEHTVIQVSTLIAKDRTKNKSSNRELPLQPDVKAYLLNLRDRQAQDKLLLGSAYQETDYVCRWPDGHVITPSYLSETFKHLVRKCGLPEETRLHDLRHTFASYLIKAGCPMKGISDLLGHSDIGTSMNLYAHLDMNAKKNAMERLSSLLSTAI